MMNLPGLKIFRTSSISASRESYMWVIENRSAQYLQLTPILESIEIKLRTRIQLARTNFTFVSKLA
jgi:hypothetical protein